MTPIPPKIRAKLSRDPFYKKCSLSHLNGCGGFITWEHSLIYAGKQVQEPFAIIPLCAKHHGVNEYQDSNSVDKDRSKWVALNRATDEDLLSISKVVNYIRERDRLNDKYGEYKFEGKLLQSKD